MAVDIFGPGGEIDIVDRSSRLLGHVAIDTLPAVTISGAISATVDMSELEQELDDLNARDFATQSTLELVRLRLVDLLAKLDVALSTRASQATLASVDAKDFATQSTLSALKTRADLLGSESTLAAVLARLDVALSTRASQATLSSIDAKDFATQATLAQVLAKLDVALSTRATESTLSTRASEATLINALAKLTDILDAVNALDITADSIAINASTINLSTDQVESLLQQIRDRHPAALDADGGEKVHVQNVPTDQLVHASNLDVALSTRASEAKLELVRALLAGTLTTTGTVTNFPGDQLVHAANLDIAVSALRDALRGSSSRTLSDLYALLAGTLIVSGTVALDAPTLAALETVNALVSGTVTANLGTIAGVATETSLLTRASEATLATRASETSLAAVRDDIGRKWNLVDPGAQLVTTSGDTQLTTITVGNHLEIVYLYAQADPDMTGSVVVQFKRGTRVMYLFTLEASQPWIRTPQVDGAANENLVVNLSTAKNVRVGWEVREVAP